MWSKAINYVNKTTELVTSTFLVIMVVVVFLQIVSRIIIQSSFPWTEELSRFLMIWLTFLGAAFSFQYGAHIGITLITNKVPRKLQAVLQIIVALLCIILFTVLMVKGYELVMKSTTQVSPALGIPMNYVYMVIPVSGFLMTLNVIDVTLKQSIALWKGGTS